MCSLVICYLNWSIKKYTKLIFLVFDICTCISQLGVVIKYLSYFVDVAHAITREFSIRSYS